MKIFSLVKCVLAKNAREREKESNICSVAIYEMKSRNSCVIYDFNNIVIYTLTKILFDSKYYLIFILLLCIVIIKNEFFFII